MPVPVNSTVAPLSNDSPARVSVSAAPWSPEAGVVLGGLLLTAVLVGLVGVASSLDVLRRRPLSILRAG